jgi:hypothetical protein
MKDMTIFSRMKNLKRLDISDHPEFFMCEEKKEALEFQALHGIDPEMKKKVTFVGQGSSIHDLLNNLSFVEELICDGDLEIHIHSQREEKGFMPNLKVVNGVSVDVKDLEVRQKQRRVQ